MVTVHDCIGHCAVGVGSDRSEAVSRGLSQETSTIGECGAAQASCPTLVQAASKAPDNSLALLKSNYSNSSASNARHCECKINVSAEQSLKVLHPRAAVEIQFQSQLAF